jgi:fructose-1,6-bisphosphatase I
MACKTTSNLINRAGLVYSIQNDQDSEDDDYSDGRFYSMKRLDRLSTTVLKNALKFTGNVRMIAPEAKMNSEKPEQHQPGVLIASALDSNYVACLDPLDGSGNADASICTGSIFGIFEINNDTKKTDGGAQTKNSDDPLLEAVLQPGKNMRAAGYCLYSSATVLVFTLKDGVYGFTLDPQIQEFVLTHDNLTIPQRGNVYSCNEANSEGWSPDWKAYLKRLKLGEGETKTRYAHRYVGSMVGDIHRTLLYGGIFAYPSGKHPPTLGWMITFIHSLCVVYWLPMTALLVSFPLSLIIIMSLTNTSSCSNSATHQTVCTSPKVIYSYCTSQRLWLSLCIMPVARH